MSVSRQNRETLQELTEKVAERSDGNPGAITVMCVGILHFGERFWTAIEGTDLRGVAIYNAYKDDCGEDLGRLIVKLEGGVGA